MVCDSRIHNANISLELRQHRKESASLYEYISADHPPTLDVSKINLNTRKVPNDSLEFCKLIAVLFTQPNCVRPLSNSGGFKSHAFTLVD